MIKIVTNSLGTGDWIIVLKDDVEIWSGHRIDSFDLVTILRSILPDTLIRMTEVTDQDIEEGDF